MTTLPQDIKERFYNTLKGDISLSDFEQWLYANKELEELLPADDYLDLIALNYNGKYAKYELYGLLRKHTDPGEFETYKLLRLLREAQQKTDELPYILMDLYDLYCKGYRFLQELGISYGLEVEAPRVGNSTADNWEELTSKEQEDLLNGFSPRLDECLEEAIRLLETKKIVLTGQQNDWGHFSYYDNRI